MPSVDVGHNWLDVLIALILLAIVIAPSVFAFLAARRAKGVKDDVTGMKKDIATNHGKKPFEYLEMVAEVRDHVSGLRMGQVEMRELLVTQAEAVAALTEDLTSHTEQDAENFSELRSLINQRNN